MGKPIATKPNQIHDENFNNRIFSWTEFAKDCVKGKYVLVIGSEAVLNKKENPEAKGDSTKFLLELTLDYLREQNIPVQETNIENFTQLGYIMYRIGEYNESLAIHVRNTIRYYSVDGFRNTFEENIEPSLLSLLQTKCFRVVLTTTIDPYVELAMEKVWGRDGFQILNIYDSANKDFEREILTQL